MRSSAEKSGTLFSYVDLESRIPEKHPLRTIRAIVNEALAALDGDFGELYSEIGRPSIPPDHLLRAMLLQIFYALRSERLLVEPLDFDLSFRWFVGLGIDDRVWDASTFSKNRDRLLDGDVAMRFLAAILDRPKVKRLVSTEHFSVDGTLIEAWASMKSFRRRAEEGSREPPADGGASGKQPDGRNGEVDFHGEKRSNATLSKLSGKSELAMAIRYGLSRWPALTRYADHGGLAIDNNAAERAIRPLAIGRKNWLFAGSDTGGERAAVIYTLIETAKLNGPDPQAYFRDVLARIGDHPINRIGDLAPWN